MSGWAIFAFFALIAVTMPAYSQPAQTACDDSLLDKISPDQMIANCTLLIDAKTAKGSELAKAYFERGTSYLMVKRFPLALNDFDETISLKPDFAAAISQRGTTYAAMNQPARAIQDFDQAIKLAPSQAGGYANRGTAHAQLGLFQQAIDDYDQAIKLEPTDAINFANRGGAYADLHQLDRAIQDFDQALKLRPDFPEVVSDRCHVLILAGRNPDATCPASGSAEPGH